jgi:hypothetical protein
VTVSTLSGNGQLGLVNGTGGATGTSEFDEPAGLAVDSAGNVIVADELNQVIRQIDTSGNSTTLAGTGTAGYADGTSAMFDTPSRVALDALGGVYVSDSSNNRIRVISLGETITLAGNGDAGFFDGTTGATGTAMFDDPFGVAVGDGAVYVADQGNNRIRKIVSGNVSTLAGNGNPTFADGPGDTASFNGPGGIAVDSAGNVYVGDTSNNRIRKIDPSGNVTTLAGNGIQGWADGTGGASGSTEFNGPRGVAVDSAGNVYVADELNNRIRKLDPQGNTTTLAGTGTAGSLDGSGGPDGVAEFSGPIGVAVDSTGTVYVGDGDNNKVRIIK